SIDVQEKICRFFGISYLEALAIGRQLVQTGEIPSGKNINRDITVPLVEKNRRIADKVSEADIVSIVSQWVTSKKETEDSLAKLQNIIENLSEGLVILDANLIIEYQNRSHREMFGASLSIGV
ncbi:MAG: PAS domain-containing protein, partial [Desulfobacteraceae bacterium]|nr:PAS domain-containing protein [Desulfobacteraceae bacterium]